MPEDREVTNFLDSLYDVYSKCSYCSRNLGKTSTERAYVQDRLRNIQEKSTTPRIKDLASSILETCEKCDATLPLVSRRLVRG